MAKEAQGASPQGVSYWQPRSPTDSGQGSSGREPPAFGEAGRAWRSTRAWRGEGGGRGRRGGEAEGAKALTVTYGYVRVLRVGGERRAAALAIIADGC